MIDVGELQARAASMVWYQAMDLGHGVTTDGFCKAYLDEAELPDFEGRTVLDIGAWDGYYSFLAERRGASRVVALEHYAWGVDFAQRKPGDFATIDPTALGTFDIVLFLGVLYHLKEPLPALEAVRRLTSGVAVIKRRRGCSPGGMAGPAWSSRRAATAGMTTATGSPRPSKPSTNCVWRPGSRRSAP